MSTDDPRDEADRAKKTAHAGEKEAKAAAREGRAAVGDEAEKSKLSMSKIIGNG
ncbi:MAG: hypothetical protein ACTHJ3_13990 [Pararhizobium sp.]